MSIPERTKETIDNYVSNRLKPGGFVHALLANDLARTIQLADYLNYTYLKQIMYYVFEHVPHGTWGSYELVDKYLNREGIHE